MFVYPKFIQYMSFRIFVITILLLFSQTNLIGQENLEEPVEKKKARISLSFTNLNNISPRLQAEIKTKVDRSYESVQGVSVKFYLAEISEENFLGYAVSGKNGKATLILQEDIIKLLKKDYDFLFIATIENNENYFDKETEVEVKSSFSSLSLDIEDSTKIVRFFVGTPDSLGITYIPAEDVEATIYVKRLFGLLRISEEFETTDEEGFLTIEFPDDIPGDEVGNLTIIAKVDDHEVFGTLTNSQEIDWGVPLKSSAEIISGEWWSGRNNAPIALIIIVNAMIFGIWGVIIYIILDLFKINKIGKTRMDI